MPASFRPGAAPASGDLQRRASWTLGRHGRLAAAGGMAWGTLVAVPALSAFVGEDRPGANDASGAGAAALALLAGAPLAAGLARLGSRAGRSLLLGAAPLGLGLAVALAPLAGVAPPQGLALVLGAAAFAFYVSVAGRLADPRTFAEADSVRFEGVTADLAAEARARRRGAMLTLGTAGAFAVAVVAPAWGGSLAPAWGAAAPEAATLTATVGAALGTLVLVLGVAPGTRRRRALPPPERRRARVVAYLVTAGVGLLLLARVLA
ncbi:MAG: hypothetical protein AAF447_20095 [Myxococcota bacterium]